MNGVCLQLKKNEKKNTRNRIHEADDKINKTELYTTSCLCEILYFTGAEVLSLISMQIRILI